MDMKLTANLYLIVGLLLGALTPVMLDLSAGMNIYEFMVITYSVSVIASLAFIIATGRMQKLLTYMKNAKTVLTIGAIGVLNYAMFEFGITYAERFVSASLVTVFVRTSPLLMLMFIPLVLREKISKYQVVALAIGFIGLFIAISGGNIGNLAAGLNPQITALLISIALAVALATVLMKRYIFDISSCMFIFSVANFVFFAILFALSGAPLSQISLTSMTSILYVGIMYNVFTGIMYYTALRMMKTTFVTNLYFLSPFLTFIFAALILEEPIKAYYIVVALLVACGIAIQKLDKIGGTYASKAEKQNRHRFLLLDVTGAFANTGEVAISRAIENGARVLAIKLHSSHKAALENTVKAGKHVNVYTDTHPSIPDEAIFVKELLGANENDMVVMKVGNVDESDRFFGELSEHIERA